MSQKIVVKVGDKSTLRLKGVKTYRAITILELKRLVEINEINIVIVEKIKDSEYTEAYNWLSEFVKIKQNSVFFYVPDNDDKTTGLADALIMDIYMYMDDIYKAIKLNCSLDVKPELKYYAEQPSGNIEDNFGGIFDDEVTQSENKNNSDIIIPNIYNTKMDCSIPNEINDTVQNDSENNQEIVKSEQINTDNSTSNELDYADNTNNLTTESSEEIIELKNTLSKYINRIEELNKLIKSVKDERDTYQKELSNIEIASILEDPATLEEYTEMKNRVAELEKKIQETSDISSEEVSKLLTAKVELETSIEKYEELKVHAEERISELEESLKEQNKIKGIAEEDILTLTKKVEELEIVINSSSENSQNEVYKLNIDITELNNVISDLRLNVENLSNSIDSKNEELVSIKKLLENERSIRQNITELLKNAVIKINELRDVKTSSEESKNYEIAQLESQLGSIREQLESKEIQYQSLVGVTGVNENSATILLENNNTLENINKNLREQLEETTKKYNKSEQEKNANNSTLDSLKEQNTKLSNQVKALSTNYTGGASISMVPPIQYQGRAQIISVFGSGSFGITTTAVSIANYLASSNKVLFIDFDMMYAKADSWFGDPFIKGLPNCESNSLKNSGLGVFINKGVQVFMEYTQSTIKEVLKNKNGSISYVSGIYEKPDVVKLVSANYSSLLNFCGSSYDYIVIDLGKIGASDINNQLIKAIFNISRNNIVVTSNDKIDIRNTRFELQRNNINFNNLSWLINLGENTKLDESCRSIINPSHIGILTFISDFYGHKNNFLQNRLSKDKFCVFLEELLKK